MALPSDREQPIRVQADSAELDDKQGVAVYRGDVVVTQGSTKLTGNTVTLKQDKNGDIEVRPRSASLPTTSRNPLRTRT